MNLLQPIRARRHRWVPRVSCVLATAWLAMAVQPCLVAAEADDHCPHCPTPMTETGSMGVSDGCTYIGSADYDGRIPHKKLSDSTPDKLPGLLAELAEIAASSGARATGPPCSRAAVPSAPPLTVLYCVYLN